MALQKKDDPTYGHPTDIQAFYSEHPSFAFGPVVFAGFVHALQRIPAVTDYIAANNMTPFALHGACNSVVVWIPWLVRDLYSPPSQDSVWEGVFHFAQSTGSAEHCYTVDKYGILRNANVTFINKLVPLCRVDSGTRNLLGFSLLLGTPLGS
jgi:hypothetical protein